MPGGRAVVNASARLHESRIPLPLNCDSNAMLKESKMGSIVKELSRTESLTNTLRLNFSESGKFLRNTESMLPRIRFLDLESGSPGVVVCQGGNRLGIRLNPTDIDSEAAKQGAGTKKRCGNRPVFSHALR